MTESTTTTTTTTTSSTTTPRFEKEHHIRYFAAALHGLSAPYAQLDTNRLTMVHFAVHALDLLGVWEDESIQQEYNLQTQQIIDWIYDCCCLPSLGGFQGGSSVGPVGTLQPSDQCSENPFFPPDTAPTPYHRPHIAMTYCALLTLHVLGDDGSRLPSKEAMLQHIRSLQRSDGSFGCVDYPSESDLRFLYCACSISWILRDWSGMDPIKAVHYIQDCVAYDGGIALVPGQEGHGGSTFCATAALRLLGQLETPKTTTTTTTEATTTSTQSSSSSSSTTHLQDNLTHWCVHRQVAGGMQGRPNKLEDTCYSYWVGGTLRILGREDLLDRDRLRHFILSCQASSQRGGFSKIPGSYPDILHSFYSLSWLSLSGDEPDLHPLNATLGIRQKRVMELQRWYSNDTFPTVDSNGDHDLVGILP